MPRGVYEHYDAVDYIQLILEGGGMPTNMAYDVVSTYLDNESAEQLLRDVAKMQKNDRFSGNSSLIFEELLIFMEGEIGGIIGQIFQDMNSVGLLRVETRFYSGFYDMNYMEQQEYIDLYEV